MPVTWSSANGFCLSILGVMVKSALVFVRLGRLKVHFCFVQNDRQAIMDYNFHKQLNL
jgi:hypothetical protein